jgi:hypothetical protein
LQLVSFSNDHDSCLVFYWSHRVLVYSFHNSSFFSLCIPLFFSIMSVLSSGSEILSSTYSSLQEWFQLYFLFHLKSISFPGFLFTLLRLYVSL